MVNNEIYQEFCLDLVDEYLSELSGNGKNDDYIIGQRPTEKIAIGILDSGFNENDIEDSKRFTQMRMIKVQFYINSLPNGSLKLKLKGNLFYNVIPTYEEAKSFVDKQNDEIRKQDLTGISAEENELFLSYDIVSKFKRIQIDEIVNNIIVSKDNLLKTNEVDFSDELNKKLYDGIDLSDAVFFNSKKISRDSLISKEKYEQYIKQNMGTTDAQIFSGNIRWQFEGKAFLEKTKDPNKNVVTSITIAIDIIKINKYCIPLYNCGLEIEAQDGLEYESIVLDNFEKSYKVDPKVKTKGEWLSAECVGNKIITNNVPKYIEKKLLTNNALKDNTDFKNLQNNPIYNLNVILKKMTDYYEMISFINSENNEYKKDVDKFKFELNRFKRGIEILDDPDFNSIKEAFVLMNKTFENQNYSSWRLFQLVFIVSMVADIVYNDNKDLLKSSLYNYSDENEAEIIYFPTGGGKTEAFLGTVVLSCFYDRLTGKNFGVNTIIKYPLRLLSIQQLERTFNVLYKANKVMFNYEPLKEAEPFSLGYFVGSSNTPNQINEDEIDKIFDRKEEYTLINKCPVCGAKIDIK